MFKRVISQHTRSSLIHKQVGWLFRKCLGSVCLATYRYAESNWNWYWKKVVSCLCVFRTHLIFLFCSTILPSPPHLEGFHCPVCIPFRIYGKICLLSPLNIFCFSLLKRFESLTNDRDSLFLFFVFITFVSFSFSNLLAVSLHPTGAIRRS